MIQYSNLLHHSLAVSQAMYQIKLRMFSYVINTEGSVYLLHPLGCSVDCVVVIGGSLRCKKLSYRKGAVEWQDIWGRRIMLGSVVVCWPSNHPYSMSCNMLPSPNWSEIHSSPWGLYRIAPNYQIGSSSDTMCQICMLGRIWVYLCCWQSVHLLPLIYLRWAQ